MQSKYIIIINKLQSDFKQIMNLFQEIQTTQTDIQSKLLQIKEIYNILITNNNKKRFLFCLDTFFFQYKTLNIGIENLNRYISLINNRMYGDYYKLNNMIILNPLSADQEPIKESIKDPIKESIVDSINIIVDTVKKYTIYQDLDLYKEYPISDTKSIHCDIINSINNIIGFYLKKSVEIQEYNTSQINISIDSFINTLKYDNTLIMEQINLYIHYLTFFHKTHISFLINLLHKIQLFQNEIVENLQSTATTDIESNNTCDLNEFELFNNSISQF